MDKTFVIDVRNKRAKNLSKIKYVCGNTDYLVAFDLDEDWSGIEAKTARFRASDGTVIDTPFTGSTCPFPRIMDAYRVDVGIYAGNLKTSTNAIVECERSALSNDGPPHDPAPDVYARIMEMLNAGVSEEQIARAVEKYLEENPADATLSIAGRAADAKATGEAVRQLSEEIADLKPETRQIATLYGIYDDSFALIGAKQKVGIRTEILSTSEVAHARLAKDLPGGFSIVVYYDLAKNPAKRVSPGETAGTELLTTIEYPYFDVEWYYKASTVPLESEEFLSLLDIAFKANDATVKHALNERKYAFPKWADIHPWVTFDGVTDDDINSAELTFASWYNRFHSLTETYPNIGLEEINLSTDYLAANTEDAIPEAISTLSNGGLYMWHLPAPAEDGAGLAVGHYTPKILILSGVHGDERDSVWCVWKLLDALCRNDAEHRAITLIRNFCDIYIVPMVNPYGIEKRTRANENNIDINRDFNVKNWAYEEGDPIYPAAPNSQYSTRCISWWMSKISPNLMIDYHRSEGDTDSLPGMFIQWGTSPYKSILSIIDENINDVTPYVRKNLAPKFDAYHHRFGHAKETLSTGIKNGTTTIFASELGIPAATYELVRRVRWNDVDILTSNDSADICAMNYHGVVNFLVKFVQYVVETLNGGLDWKATIDW